MAAGGTTNENDTANFKEWMAAIKHKNRYTTSTGGWLQLERLNKKTTLKNRMRKKGLLKRWSVLISSCCQNLSVPCKL